MSIINLALQYVGAMRKEQGAEVEQILHKTGALKRDTSCCTEEA